MWPLVASVCIAAASRLNAAAFFLRHIFTVADEMYEAVSRTGARDEVRLGVQPDDLAIRVGPQIFRPAWGSQAYDDWLDWVAGQRRGEPVPLPVDEPDWLKDEGYHR
jgi:hypothetical protein